MLNFAERITRPFSDDYPVRNLTDIDFYKFTMGQFIHKYYPDVKVRFSLINREQHIPLAKIINEAELRSSLDYVRSLSFRRTDLYYLRGMDVYGQNMFSNEYLSFLQNLKLPEYELTSDGEQYELSFFGKWAEVTMWETIAMTIITELYYRSLMRRLPKIELENMYGLAKDKLYRKLLSIKEHQGIKFADFGQRRRHSFLWQKYAINMASEVLGSQFTGTSNTYMAFGADLIPIGTNAHELPMVITALKMAEENDKSSILSAQYIMLEKWEQMYGKGLRIILPDTYGSKQFFANMDDKTAQRIANDWHGIRHDSGSPIEECGNFISWLKGMNIDAKKAGKLCIFSDGLDVKTDGSSINGTDIVSLYNKFKDEINIAFGWGTNFTNDFRNCLSIENENIPEINLKWKDVFKGFSLVCKVSGVEANGNILPVVKLSNNINKATGPSDEVKKYIDIFGDGGRITQKVTV